MNDAWGQIDGVDDKEGRKEGEEQIALVRREASIIANAFKGEAGQKALALLREKTYGRNGRDLLEFTDPKLLDRYMIHRDGQNAVMRMIEQMIDIDSGKIKIE